MENFSKRLKQLLDTLEIKPATFEARIHCATGTIYRCVTNNTTLTIKTLQAIKKYFPKVNLNWLISGSGSMFCDDAKKEATALNKPYTTDIQQYIEGIARLNDLVSKQSANLDTLLEVTERLMSEINEKKANEKKIKR